VNLLTDEMKFREHHIKKGSSGNSVVCDFFRRLGNCRTCEHYCGTDSLCFRSLSNEGVVSKPPEHYCAEYKEQS